MYSTPEFDQVARRIAELILTKCARDYDEAVVKLQVRSHEPIQFMPSRSLVRSHLAVMRQCVLGDAGYQEARRAVFIAVEELFTLLDHAFSPYAMLIAGRAARGKLDEPPVVHVRVYTKVRIAVIVDCLLQHGYPEPRFETALTRYGRLQRIRIHEPIAEIVLTRCHPDQYRTHNLDLHTGQPIPTADLEAIRRRITQDRP